MLAVLRGTLPAASPTLEVDGERWTAIELFHETFADESWRERWRVEGEAEVEAREGRLTVVTSREPGGADAATIWWREALPADVLIEFTGGSLLPADGNNAANLNLFVHARELDGGAYRFGRSGTYGDYHKFPNYIFTLTGGFQEGWARARRNPGFKLVSENRAWRSEVGRSYRFRVLTAGGRVRGWIDGHLVHDFVDTDPLPGGYLALRTWRSRVWWSNVRVMALTRARDRLSGRDPATELRVPMVLLELRTAPSRKNLTLPTGEERVAFGAE